MTPLGLEALGFTIEAGMLFAAGALGAWGRAKSSTTQRVFSKRTLMDVLIGGTSAALLPRLIPLLDIGLLKTFDKWSALERSCLAFILGFGGSYTWTTVAWKTGLIVTPKHLALRGIIPPPPPESGVLKPDLPKGE